MSEIERGCNREGRKRLRKRERNREGEKQRRDRIRTRRKGRVEMIKPI